MLSAIFLYLITSHSYCFLWGSVIIFMYAFTLFPSGSSIQAYVQQLESSRLKLTQLEQELQRARQQVGFLCTFFIWPGMDVLYHTNVLYVAGNIHFKLWRSITFDEWKWYLNLLISSADSYFFLDLITTVVYIFVACLEMHIYV